MIWLILILFSLVSPVLAQTNASIRFVTVAPSGSCQARSNLSLLTPNGILYTCQSGTWTAATSAGSPGTVTSVSGTTNEISVATGTTTPVISIPAVIDLGGKTSLEIPNAAAPTTNVFGQIAGDNNIWGAGRGAIQTFDGTANTFLVGVLASDTPTNGQVPTWNTGGTITWETVASGITINTTAVSGGSAGCDLYIVSSTVGCNPKIGLMTTGQVILGAPIGTIDGGEPQSVFLTSTTDDYYVVRTGSTSSGTYRGGEYDFGYWTNSTTYKKTAYFGWEQMDTTDPTTVTFFLAGWVSGAAAANYNLLYYVPGSTAGDLYFGSHVNTPTTAKMHIGQTGDIDSIGRITPASFGTATNCSDSAGAAACGSAAAGAFVVDAAGTSTVVSTTAVTANSEILVFFDASLSTRLGITCNSTVPALYGVTARTAGTSFTLTASSPVTNPACFNFLVIN